MIERMTDAAGNVSGFWDTDKNCWVRDPELEAVMEDLQPEELEEPQEPVDPNDLTKDQLSAILEEWEVSIPAKASKLMLVELYEQNAPEE
jgi:hypothetical protein